MKPQMQPVELQPADDRFAEGAEQVWQDSGYLPPQDDQSWREQDAHRIVTADRPIASAEPVEADRVGRDAQSEFCGFGRVETFFALFTVAAIAIFIAALTVPDILTAGYWRAHPNADPASAPIRLAAIPAPVLEHLPRPDGNGAKAEAFSAPQMVAPTPAPRPGRPAQAREKARDQASNRDAGGFYANVAQPDGTLAYRYFPSSPRLDPEPAVPAVPRNNAGTGGFYAMVAGPGGTLEYKYFPPGLAR